MIAEQLNFPKSPFGNLGFVPRHRKNRTREGHVFRKAGQTLPDTRAILRRSVCGCGIGMSGGKVEMWRGGFRLDISVFRPFRSAVPQ